jgi:capsular exopolysaccharide synthesis family protein
MAKKNKRSTAIEVAHRGVPAAPAWPAGPPERGAHAAREDLRTPGEEEGLDWRRYFAAIYRYKWLILLVTAAGTGAGVVATRQLYQYEYSAEAKLWIEDEEGGSGRNQGPLRSSLLLDPYSWIELLETYAVLEEVVRDHYLYVSFPPQDSSLFHSLTLKERVRPGAYRLEVDGTDRTVTVSTRRGILVERSAVGDSIGAENLGFEWAPPADSLPAGLSAEFSVVTYRLAAQRLKSRLNAWIDRDGNFMTVTLEGWNPDEVANTLNAVIERYVALTADIKRVRLGELTGIIEQQLRIARQNLITTEDALESFRVATITLPSEPASPVAPGLRMTEDPVFNNFFQMRVEEEQLRRDRVELQRILASAGSRLSTNAVEVIPSVRTSSQLTALLEALTEKRAELQALRTRYTDEHPEVVRLVEEVEELELESIPTALGTLLSTVTNRQAELTRRLQSASQDLQRIPPRVIELSRLERARDIAEDLFTTLSQRYEEARLGEASSIPDVRILDRAVAPRSPNENEASRFILMAFAGSLGLAVLGAVVLDRSGRRIQYPTEVTRDMGLTILGSIPRVHRRNGRQDARDLHQVVEALRAIRMSLMHAYGGPMPLMLTVTSPGAAEGKSFVTSNLAIAYAEAGLTTLLVDGDVRRGHLHRMFHRSRKPGLTDFLVGAAPRDQVVHRTGYPGLSFVPCGTRQERAPDFLGSAAMYDLLQGVREEFGVILVDSPPMMAGVDPLLLASATGNLMLVLRTGTSDRHLAEAKLAELERMPIRVLGAVLNDVRSSPVSRYYHEYSSYGLLGYEAKGESDDEEDASKLLPRPAG